MKCEKADDLLTSEEIRATLGRAASCFACCFHIGFETKMTVTRQKLAEKLTDYLDHRITLAQLTIWAESAMMEADFEDKYFELIRDIVARLGLGDVREFGIYWEDCEDFLSRLGYRVRVTVSEAKSA